MLVITRESDYPCIYKVQANPLYDMDREWFCGYGQTVEGLINGIYEKAIESEVMQ